jgi:signal peptidase I
VEPGFSAQDSSCRGGVSSNVPGAALVSGSVGKSLDCDQIPNGAYLVQLCLPRSYLLFRPNFRRSNSFQCLTPQPQTAAAGRRLLLRIAAGVLVSCLAAVPIITRTSTYKVRGASMYPTLREGDTIEGRRCSTSELRRGDVVFFRPENPSWIVNFFDLSGDKIFVKRLVGLPGDAIQIRQGVLRVNGVQYKMRIPHRNVNEAGTWVVPEGHCFVLGDNLHISSDSRAPSVGMVELGSLRVVVGGKHSNGQKINLTSPWIRAL